ncbi:MAG: hypothetical protein H0X33_14445 [Taibaiella sp.]|nr:hypothetical protein [Taibaiella sp.]
MAVFELNNRITIGKPGINRFAFKSVHEVRIKRSLLTHVDTATIRLPSRARVKCKIGSSQPQTVTVGNLWQDGDPVTIELGYNGDLREEFRGFIKRRDLSYPLEIECEGYSYQMRRNSITRTWKSISCADLLKAAIVDTYIKKIICPADTVFTNLQITDGTGADIIESIKKNTAGALSVFFIEPDVLWCGLVYTPYQQGQDAFGLGQVKYRIGYNVVQDNGLKERTLKDNQVQHIYVHKTQKGELLYGKSSVFFQQIRKYKKFLNNLAQALHLKECAQENMLRDNYTGYDGSITPFLQPYCLPGYTALLKDSRYPEKDGIYMVEATEVIFGVQGARRIVQIGPKVGFDVAANGTE